MKRDQFCPNCEEYRETRLVDREETYAVRGEKITVPVKVRICSSCGESIGSDEADQEILDAVYAEYRRRFDLLTPERIKAIRQRYRLSQKSFAVLLGMSEATINRYEKGGLQDQAHDTAIRACEKPEIVRDLLARRGHLLSDWQRKRVEKALAGQAELVGPWIDLMGQAPWVETANEVSDRTGFRRFDSRRFASVVLWFCRELGNVSKTVVNKLLFYADFLNFRTATVSLTGTAYRKAPYGPVPTDYGALLAWMEAQGLLECEEVEYPNGYTGFYYRAGPNAESAEVEFSPHEQKVLKHVADVLGRLTAKDISSKSHQEPAWKDATDGEIISYQESQNLSLALPD